MNNTITFVRRGVKTENIYYNKDKLSVSDDLFNYIKSVWYLVPIDNRRLNYCVSSESINEINKKYSVSLELVATYISLIFCGKLG